MREFFISIPGEPVGKQSVRTGMGRAYMPEKTSSWTAYAVEMIARQWPKGVAPLDGPLRLTILGVKPRPKKLLAKSAPANRMPWDTKPDADNISKMVCDAMTKAGVWTDDSRIFDLRVLKAYVAKEGDLPCVEILLESVDPATPLHLRLHQRQTIDNDSPFG